MKNLEALATIRQELEQVIRENKWKFILRPIDIGIQCTTWVQSRDVTDRIDIPGSCELIAGGRNFNPEASGDLDNVPERLAHAKKQLFDYAKLCGIDGNGSVKAVDPVKDLIKKYKLHLEKNHLEDEVYKWELVERFKGRPNVDAEDFYEEIKSINYENLIFYNGTSVMHQLAKEKPEEYRNCYKMLFNESVPLNERLTSFSSETHRLFKEIVPDPKRSSHHDERTMATILTLHNPDKYAFYKDSFYQKYCKLTGNQAKRAGEKYAHYLELLEDFIANYIIPDAELIEAVNQLLPDNAYQDLNHKLLAQDILYKMLDGSTEVKQKDEEALRGLLKRFSIEHLITYFHTLDRLIEDLDIQNESKLAFSTSGKLSFQVGIRFCLNLEKDQFYFIAPEDYKIEGVEKGQFEGNSQPSFFHKAPAEIILQHYPAIKEAVRFELESNKYTDKKKYDNSAFRRAAFDREYRATLFDFQEVETIASSDSLLTKRNQPMPLNQILFGPPGTGKTYNTINKALEILGEKTEGIDRSILKQLFEKKVTEGQIMFTTFHQSMSYEDFIEGIKPQEAFDKDGNTIITYKVEPGIFKKICDRATTKQGSDNFDEVYEQFAEDVQADDSLLLRTPRHNKPFKVTVNSNKNFVARPETETATPMVITKDMIRDYLFYGKIRDWKPYTVSISEHLKSKYILSIQTEAAQKKDYVLIIDEINRGNVSQIFGELITLIEEDKRLGGKEQLEVTLPYSKEKFGVPANLYIIGTMNTADRSVEALDTALRRRFSFVEMPPRYDLETLQKEVEGYKLADILQKINRRIEKLLGKDNLIGHSYFLCVENAEDLRAAFQNKIIPLLQEYFYGDYGKIGLVLGEGFFQGIEEDEEEDIFASFGSYDSAGLAEKEVYHLAELIGTNRLTDIAFREALDKLMK